MLNATLLSDALCYALPTVLQDDFPSLEDIRQAALVVIGGSHYSAYENHPWIHKLVGLLPQYVATGGSVAVWHPVLHNTCGLMPFLLESL
jgi:GMP synthase-like glutamine amidotransferase